MVNQLSLLVAIPLAVAVINLFLPVVIRKISTLLVLIFNTGVVYTLYASGAYLNVAFLGVNIAALDKMSLFALTFIQILSIIILIFSLKGLEGGIEKQFFVLYPMTVSFSNGVVISQHALVFLIFWGLSGLTLYWFALLGKNKETPATAKKTFILIGSGDALLIVGFVLMFMRKSFAHWLLNVVSFPLHDSTMYLAFFLLLGASFTKAGGFPLHTWVPDFSKDAPVESAAFLPASLDKLLGIYLLSRMMMSYFKVDTFISMIVVTLGALTVITAVMMAMNQHNARRLLGYHAVSQVGYMIMGVGSGSILAFAGGLFHLINNTIYKSNLFLCLGSVEKRSGTNDLDKLGGLGRLMPFTFVMALIGSLSISGIPPFNGFFSKWMLYQGLLEETANLSKGYQIWLLICIILAVFGSVLTLASFMKFLHAIFLGKRPQELDNVKEAPLNQLLATGLLALLCIVFGLFAQELPLRQFIYPAVQSVPIAPTPAFIGLYQAKSLILLFALISLLGFIIYLLTRKVRYDDVYICGNSPMEHFRVVGTEFYNEIRNMKPLKTLYDWAEKKYFDVYDLGAGGTFGFSHLLQKAHPGQLQLYILYIVIGMLIFICLS